MSIISKPTHQFFSGALALAPHPAITEEIEFRVLNAGDFQAFRALRLEALSGPDAKYFGAFYENEAAQSDDQWRERCTETASRVLFGAFFGGALVGVMAATKSEKHERTVLWGSVYLQPPFRQKHVAEGLYLLRQAWSEASGLFDRAIFFIREGNERSTAIHIKNGAKIIGREVMTFADGLPATALWFERTLKRQAALNVA